MPWRNGGGETIEIAVHPPGAGLGDFDWRVSMARVEADGPFSVFEGVERTLSVLAGQGMELALGSLGRRLLTKASDPFGFPADVVTNARLVNGPIEDLNVMSRRGVVRHEVVRIDTRPSDAPRVWTKPWTLLVAGGPCRILADGSAAELAPGDALCRLEGSEEIALGALGALGEPAPVFVVRFHADA